MSVIVIGHMTVEPGNVEKLWKERKEVFEAIRTSAEAAGAKHHQWAFGDGQVVIIDEWNDPASFQKFFDGDTRIADLMQAAGVQGPPTFEILESKVAPDTF
jgi:quinol monooxygenase YgiN